MITCETCIWYKPRILPTERSEVGEDNQQNAEFPHEPPQVGSRDDKPSGWCLYNPPVISTAEGRPRTYAEDRCNSYETPEELSKWRRDILEIRDEVDK